MAAHDVPPSPDGWFADPDKFGGDYPKLLMEQYKLYVDTSTKVSDRRAAAQTFLLSANTLLTTVYGFVGGKDARLAAQGDEWRWLIPLAGLLLSITWFALIRSYRALNSAKFEVIHGLERRLPARLFEMEWVQLERGKGRLYLPLSYLEQAIPLIFAAIYIALAASALRPG